MNIMTISVLLQVLRRFLVRICFLFMCLYCMNLFFITSLLDFQSSYFLLHDYKGSKKILIRFVVIVLLQINCIIAALPAHNVVAEVRLALKFSLTESLNRSLLFKKKRMSQVSCQL